MDTILLWRDLFHIANKVCRKFKLTYGKIEPATRLQYHHYGTCEACPRCVNGKKISTANCREKIIRIRLHQVHRKNRPLKLSTIVDTLAHEMAHLAYWDHSLEHHEFQKRILDYIQSIGYNVKALKPKAYACKNSTRKGRRRAHKNRGRRNRLP